MPRRTASSAKSAAASPAKTSGVGGHVSVVFSDAARPVGLGRFSRVTVNPDNGRREREARYRRDLGPASVVNQPTEPAAVRHFPDAPDATWHLHLELADAAELTDERDWLPPGSWTVRLIVGADDGDTHAYEVDLGVGRRRVRRGDASQLGAGSPRSPPHLTRRAEAASRTWAALPRAAADPPTKAD